MTGKLPDWLADWLGAGYSASDEAANWRIDLAWPWPPWATVLLVLTAIAWVSFCYVHETSSAGRRYRAMLATLRLAVVALLLIMLTQATLTVERTGPPTIALVIDRSASMDVTDRYEDSQLARRLRERLRAAGLGAPTRLNLAKHLLLDDATRLLERLAADYRLHVYFAADGVERVAAEDASAVAAAVRALSADGPASGGTRLGDALRYVLDDLRGPPPAGIVLLSDGVVTAGRSLADAAADARTRGVPLLAIGLGSDRPPRDVELTDVLVDDAAFVDDLVGFAVQIKSRGLEAESVQLVLRREDEATPLAEQTVTIGPSGVPQTAFLTHRPTTAGAIPYVVEVVPRADETNLDNNRQRRAVSVVDQKIRVLLAFGYPNYEFRFLKTLLERDATVELATYLQDADPEHAEQDRTALRALPRSRDELFDYDVLVLGDLDPQLVPRSTWPEVRAFVAERGGGAVFVAGPRFLPWAYGDVSDVAALLPIEIDAMEPAVGTLLADVTRGFAVRPTTLGLRMPPLQLGDSPAETEQMWRRLAPLYWLAESARLKPAAQVLAEHPTLATSEGRHAPIIVSQYVGAGKVVFHATDSTWRWRIGAGDVFFARYWVQTIRYLARGKLAGGDGAELTTNRREYRPNDTVHVRLRFLDQRLAPTGDEAIVVLDRAGSARRRVALRRSATAGGVFEGSIAEPSAGQYELLLAEPAMTGDVPSARFSVIAPPGEMARTQMDRAALTAAAAATRGKFYTIADADRVADELPRGQRVPIASLAPLELWNRWWLLAPLLILLVGEWIMRKRCGML